MMKLFSKHFSNPESKVIKDAHRQLSAISKRHYNLQIYDQNLSWLNDPEFITAVKAWGKIRGLPKDRRFFLYNTAKSLRKIEGHTVDIGVRFGTSSYFLLKGFNDPLREHHLFDSFEGVSEPTPEDKHSIWKKGLLAVDENVTRKNLAGFKNCFYHKGWIPERFGEVKDKIFAFVHIDVDLYQPTLDSINFFYERTVPGGAILCDDYGSLYCPGAKKALDDFFSDKRESIIHIPTGQSLVIKG